jgi:hypothetical protein
MKLLLALLIVIGLAGIGIIAKAVIHQRPRFKKRRPCCPTASITPAPRWTI